MPRSEQEVTCGLLQLCSEPHPSSSSTDLADTKGITRKSLITLTNSMTQALPWATDSCSAGQEVPTKWFWWWWTALNCWIPGLHPSPSIFKQNIMLWKLFPKHSILHTTTQRTKSRYPTILWSPVLLTLASMAVHCTHSYAVQPITKLTSCCTKPKITF